MGHSNTTADKHEACRHLYRTLKMPRKTKNQFTLLSLFSGAGALDQGFDLTGRFITRACVEFEPIFCRTLEANQTAGFLPQAAIINESVTALDPHDVMRLHFKGSAPDGIIGGPPCETFSVRGKRKGLNDPKGSLVFSFLDWVIALRPAFFLMENVPPLATLNNGSTIALLCEKASKAGYATSYSILNAADFGAPTKRRRLFLVGILDGKPIEWPEASHCETPSLFFKQPYITSGEALAGLPELSWVAPGEPQGHIGVRHTVAVSQRFAGLKQGQQDNVRKRTRLHLLKPSPTLVAGNLQGIRSHIHPTEPRELTNRESARLHGFDDAFVFSGGHAAMGKQIANSVPIALARAIGSTIAAHLDSQLAIK